MTPKKPGKKSAFPLFFWNEAVYLENVSIPQIYGTSPARFSLLQKAKPFFEILFPFGIISQPPFSRFRIWNGKRYFKRKLYHIRFCCSPRPTWRVRRIQQISSIIILFSSKKENFLFLVRLSFFGENNKMLWSFRI